MKTRSFAFLGACAVALILSTIPVANAGLAVDFATPTTDFTNGYWSLGFEFNVTSPVQVTQLGFYDDAKNDLTESHDIGIWDPSGNLLVSGTVNPGDPLSSWFRWANVTPTLLAVGNGYVIAAVTGSENYTWNPTGFVTDPAITFVNARATFSTTLVYPTDSASLVGFFGPNFALTDVSVPEPSTWMLLGLGLAGLLRSTRKYRSI